MLLLKEQSYLRWPEISGKVAFPLGEQVKIRRYRPSQAGERPAVAPCGPAVVVGADPLILMVKTYFHGCRPLILMVQTYFHGCRPLILMVETYSPALKGRSLLRFARDLPLPQQ